MPKNAFTYIEAVAFIVAVAVPVHYLGGIDWPPAVGIGAAASIALRWLIHRGMAMRPRRPVTGGH